jgi:DNA-directed RNA polymerase alpha subunit
MKLAKGLRDSPDLDQMLSNSLISNFRSRLSTRAYRVLFCSDIDTIGQLAAKTDKDLLSLPGCGPVTLNDIRAFLSRLGLTLCD